MTSTEIAAVARRSVDRTIERRIADTCGRETTGTA
jgi:hypothetical protein